MAMIFEDKFLGAGYLEDHVSNSLHTWRYLGGGAGSKAVLSPSGAIVEDQLKRSRYAVVEADYDGSLNAISPPFTIQSIFVISDPDSGVQNTAAAGLSVYGPPGMALDNLYIANRCELSYRGDNRMQAAAGSGSVMSTSPYNGGIDVYGVLGENTLITVVSETHFEYVFNGVLFMSEAHGAGVTLGGLGFIMAGPHTIKSLKVWEGTSIYPPGPPDPDPYDAGWWRNLSNAAQTL